MVVLLLIPSLIVASVVAEFVAVRRGGRRIERWASDNHYELQSVTRRWLRSGPWGFWYSGRACRIFEVAVTDRNGQTRTGFAKVSGGWGGVVADVIEMRWVPEPAA